MVLGAHLIWTCKWRQNLELLASTKQKWMLIPSRIPHMWVRLRIVACCVGLVDESMRLREEKMIRGSNFNQWKTSAVLSEQLHVFASRLCAEVHFSLQSDIYDSMTLDCQDSLIRNLKIDTNCSQSTLQTHRAEALRRSIELLGLRNPKRSVVIL